MVDSSKYNNQDLDNEYLLKICALGSANIGKTQLIRAFAENKFETNYLPTLGVDITTKKIILGGNQVKLILVDTAGQEFFGKLRPSYYRGATAGLFFCNIDNKKSIKAIPSWLKEFLDYFPSSEKMPIGLVVIEGWKSVKRKEKRKKTKLSLKERLKIQLRFGASIQRTSHRFLSFLRIQRKKSKRRMVPTSINRLKNLQLAKKIAIKHQMEFFLMKVDDSEAIQECVKYMAQRVISR